MDPVSLVVVAFVTGLTAGITDSVETVVKDLYAAFKARLYKNVDGKSDAQEALAAVEKKPQSAARQEVLKEELSQLEIEKDIELLKLAKSIMNQVDENGTRAGKYDIKIDNAQGVVIGDHNKVNQTFVGNKK